MGGTIVPAVAVAGEGLVDTHESGAGATVSALGIMYLPTPDDPIESGGDSAVSNHAMQVVLGSFQNTLVSDANGLVTMNPSNGGLYRLMQLQIMISAGASANLQFAFQQLPAMVNGNAGGEHGAGAGACGIRNSSAGDLLR